MRSTEPTGHPNAGWTDVMIGRACCHAKNLDRYAEVIPSNTLEDLRELADRLKGVRICHINSTPFGGGVAELLASVVPMVQSLGLTMDWRVIHGSPQFFAITKGLHNALQGGEFDLSEQRRRHFLAHNQACAALLRERYDVYIVNDPQPVALRHFHGQGGAHSKHRAVGILGRRHVREHFLMPRLIRDELALVSRLVGATSTP